MQHSAGPSFSSGVPPIDRLLGGAPEGRIILIGGASGTGKSAACLQFLGEALRRGERAVLLTQHRIADVRSHAQRVGLDLRAAVRDGRLVLLRFTSSFAGQIALGALPSTIIDELRRLIGDAEPTRIAVDSISPLLAGGARASARVEALAEYLEATGATTLLTYPADLASADRVMEPLVHRAAAILRLTREERGRLRLDHVNARFAPPGALTACYTVGNGCIECVDEREAAAGAAAPAPRRDGPVVILHAHDTVDEDLRALVAREHPVQVLPARDSAAPENASAILIEASHATLAAAARTLRALARSEAGTPLVIVSRYALRSLDRARLLRAGADECLVHETGAAEFFARLDAVIARGRDPSADARALASPEEIADTQPPAGTRGGMLARGAFARALAEHVTRDDPVQYSVVSLATAADEADDLPELAELASRTMRARSGDLVTTHEDRVLVYLHGARQRDGAAFLERVRERWAALGHRPLRIEALTYPADEPRLRSLITTGRSS